jgi:hypothetical protein
MEICRDAAATSRSGVLSDAPAALARAKDIAFAIIEAGRRDDTASRAPLFS